jgi:methionyl-tRNA formyltransferase
VHRAVIAGETETGVTIMRVVQALDAGPMLSTATRAIGPDETSDAVERGLASIGATLLVQTLDAIAAGHASHTEQDEARATYAPRLTKADGVVDWRWSAARLHDLIRGLHPWPHASGQLNGQRLIFLRSTPDPAATHAAPGTIVTSKEVLRIATGSGLIQIDEIQLEGRRPMPTSTFLAGHRLVEGQRFDAHP